MCEGVHRIGLMKKRITEIWIGKDSRRFAQNVVYENVPKYCQGCKHIDHDLYTCYVRGRNPKSDLAEVPTDLRILIEKERGKQVVQDHDENKDGGGDTINSGDGAGPDGIKIGIRIQGTENTNQNSRGEDAAKLNQIALSQNEIPRSRFNLESEPTEDYLEAGHISVGKSQSAGKKAREQGGSSQEHIQ